MFFVLSKVLDFLSQPFFYIVLTFVLSFVIQKEWWKKRLRNTSLVLLLFFSNSFIIDEVSRWWEIPVTRMDYLEHYDCAILLGGMTGRYDKKNERVNFHGGVDRLLQTLVLQKNYKVKTILLSGGSGYLMHPEEKESEIIGKYLNDIDYDLTDFWIEKESRNTVENAQYTIKMLKEKYGSDWQSKRYILVTSGYHMRRAKACFEKQGLQVEMYSTNMKSGPRRFHLDHMLIPTISALGRWEALGHEIIGYLVYMFLGYL